jgi:peptidoglycan/xylan/chitin deacetylase (PgdA/CDA1 family)
MQIVTRKLLAVALKLAYKTGLAASIGRSQPKGVSIFMFHGVDEVPVGRTLENCLQLHTRTFHFRKLCKVFAEWGNVVSLHDAAEGLAGRRKLGGHEIVITFDDGYANNYTNAFPYLKEFKLPATIFAATEFIHQKVPLWPDRLEYALQQTKATSLSVSGVECMLKNVGEKKQAMLMLCQAIKALPQEEVAASISQIEAQLGVPTPSTDDLAPFQRPLSWEQCREMESTGLVDIAAHTHRHLILGRCSEATADAEMQQNLDLLEQHLGRRTSHFAFPNGKIGDYTPAAIDTIAQAGIKVAVTTELGRNFPESSSPLTLLRYGVPESRSHAFALANGISESLRRLLRRPKPQ